MNYFYIYNYKNYLNYKTIRTVNKLMDIFGCCPPKNKIKEGLKTLNIKVYSAFWFIWSQK